MTASGYPTRTKRQRIRLSRVDATGPTGRWSGRASPWGRFSAVRGWTRAPACTRVAHDGRRHEQARRRAQANGGGRGYQVRRWSNSKAEVGGSAGAADGS